MWVPGRSGGLNRSEIAPKSAAKAVSTLIEKGPTPVGAHRTRAPRDLHQPVDELAEGLVRAEVTGGQGRGW